MVVESIERAKALYEAVNGEETALITTPEELLKALELGLDVLMVELPWRERRADGYLERHQIVPSRIAEDRLYYSNALGAEGPAGTELGGRDQGPLRRIEAAGQESMDRLTFLMLFASGGKALLAPKPS